MSATLTSKITESITLDTGTINSSSTLTHGSIVDVTKRIVTVLQTEATVATFSAAVAAGNYIAASVRYIRFTNLDSTNFITLTFRNQDNDEVAIKLDAGQSFIWNGDNVNGMTSVFNATEDADAASDTAFGSLTNIQAEANAGSGSKMEMFIASV